MNIMSNVGSVLMGAVAMASFVATVFFLRFWRQTRDVLFLLFAIAFGVDAMTRFILGLIHPTDETEPLFYAARFITFMLIAVGIILKNRPERGKRQ
jgi:uncharacterized membrane protein HdeD (DUF308 family)